MEYGIQQLRSLRNSCKCISLYSLHWFQLNSLEGKNHRALRSRIEHLWHSYQTHLQNNRPCTSIPTVDRTVCIGFQSYRSISSDKWFCSSILGWRLRISHCSQLHFSMWSQPAGYTWRTSYQMLHIGHISVGFCLLRDTYQLNRIRRTSLTHLFGKSIKSKIQ